MTQFQRMDQAPDDYQVSDPPPTLLLLGGPFDGTRVRGHEAMAVGDTIDLRVNGRRVLLFRGHANTSLTPLLLGAEVAAETGGYYWFTESFLGSTLAKWRPVG